MVEGSARLAAHAGLQTAGLLRHAPIPFVSYPYEWPFGMLKDAALLQLELLLAALQEDMILKDASPYNVQWLGARPVFVDIGSFEPLREGEPWVAYRQFCMLYLYPLLIQARKGVSFQPWLRGRIDGIPPVEMRRLMSPGDRFRRGLLSHVFLHARLEQKHAQRSREGARSKEVRSELRAAGFSKRLIAANAGKLRKLVERLEWSPPAGVWTEYRRRNTYSDEDARRKAAFVGEVVGRRRRRLTWDIGCNDGRYSRIAAEGADHVLALDADQGPVELLYRDLRERGDQQILPLTMDLADPSPGLGWRGAERMALPERGLPDLVLALALVHHLAIGANVPVRELLGWLAGLGGELVIEFPTREDPMVEQLLAAKREGLHLDYEREAFEHCLSEAFEVERSERLASGTRLLYEARPRRAVA